MTVAVSVVILTQDEEPNVGHALRSVVDWTDDVHVVDSGSTDRTLDIAKRYTSQVHYNAWHGWAAQREWAMRQGLKYDWVLFLDADEVLTPAAADEIARRTAAAPPDVHGFTLPFDFIFLGVSIRNGMRPHLRLVRRSQAHFVGRGAREYCELAGEIQAIEAPLLHDDRKGLDAWITKMNRNATLEAQELLAPTVSDQGEARDHEGLLRKLFRKARLERLPFGLPAATFGYRLLTMSSKQGIRESLLYTFFFGLWYPLLVEARVLELKVRQSEGVDPDGPEGD